MTGMSQDDIDLITQQLRKALESEGGLEMARAGGPPGLWDLLSQDLGLTGLGLPEPYGGLGADLRPLVAVARALGGCLTPVPFVAQGAAAQVLAAVPTPPDLLSACADGSARIIMTPPGMLTWDGTTLSGRTGPVVGLAEATHHLLRVIHNGAAHLILTKALPVQPLHPLDASRPVARLALDQHKVTPLWQSAPGPWEGAALARAHLVQAAEAAGAARAVFEITRAYLSERRQFGRRIDSYQAIKHRLAQLFVDLNALDALIDGAAEADPGPVFAAEAEGAHLRAVALLEHASAEAIQMHGGIGVTEDAAPQLFFKRAVALRAELGTPDLASVGAALRAGALPAAPATGQEALRARVAAWMEQALSGDFAPLRDRAHAGDGDALPDLRKAWEQHMAQGGWLGLDIPKAQGGQGLSIAEQVAFHEEYARAGGPGRMGHIGEGLLAPTLLQFGTPEQIARHLPGILSGRVFWAQGYSEPGAGSDLAAIRTRAEAQPDGSWRVTGQKIWTSLAHVSDWIFVLARAEAGSVGRAGLVFLLMPLDQPGIDIRPIAQMNGGAEFNEVFFDGAVAAAGDMLGAEGQGWEVAMALLGHERGLSTLGQQMGFARELSDIAALATPAHDDALGRAWVGLRAMRHGALRMLSDIGAGRAGPEALGYKLEWSHWHRDLGELALRVLGPEAATWPEDQGLARLVKMALFTRADTIYGGTSEIQLNIIAERGLALPRERRGET